MANFDIDSLVTPISDEAPSGENLEYDADFMALERAAAPKAERAVGDSVIAAEEPDWKDVAEQASALLGRSKDYRVAYSLTTAWLQTGGFPGLAAGLDLIHRFTVDFWPTVHPQLDAEDDDDPTFRVNSVAPLSSADGLLRYLRNAYFVSSPRVGRFSLRDLRIANGTIKPSGQDDAEASDLPSLALIEGCCQDCPEEDLASVTEAVSASLEHARGIDRAFTDQIGSAGPDFKVLVADLAELKKFLDAQLTSRQSAGADSDAAAGEEGAVSSGGEGGRGGVSVAASSGRIASLDDVRRRLDEICEYYARAEPSSPVPHLLRRAHRLVGKTFLELMEDLAPAGVPEFRVISGPTEDSQDGSY